MKKFFQKIGSFGMAFVVLFSTMSFTVEQHFCGKVLVDQAVFSEVEPCCMDLHDTASSENDIAKDTCCKQEKISIEGQNELKISFHQLDFPQQIFVSAFTYSFLNLFEGLPEQVIPFQYYSPPLLLQDIPVLNQSFLI